MRRDEGQSFSARVKQELIHLPLGKPCCMLSEIAALTQTSGHLSMRGGGSFSVSWRVENAGVARRLFLLLKRRLNVTPVLHFIQSPRLGGQRTCVLTLTGEDARQLLETLHMMETDETGTLRLRYMVPRHPLTRICCRRAFFRAAFLGAGTMTNPERGYHLEFQAGDGHLTHTLSRMLEKSELPIRTYERMGQTVLYLKSGQQVADMLALMGAGQSVLEMENIRAARQLRATATRAANCDEHNGERALDAALSQVEAIRQIALRQGLFTLPPALREMARLRLEHPELNLREIGERMDPPLGRSGVNHRLRRLMEIAAQLDAEDEKKEPKERRDT